MVMLLHRHVIGDRVRWDEMGYFDAALRCSLVNTPAQPRVRLVLIVSRISSSQPVGSLSPLASLQRLWTATTLFIFACPLCRGLTWPVWASEGCIGCH